MPVPIEQRRTALPPEVGFWHIFHDMWGRNYPATVRLWENAWSGVLSDGVWGRVHSVPAVRHRDPPHRLPHQRDRVGDRRHFPNETATLKCVYTAIMSLDPTGKGQTRWILRWKTVLNAFDITFNGRLSAARQ